MRAVDRIIAMARGELGYVEKATNERLDDKLANPGKNNWTKYARDLDGLGQIYNGRKNGYDWCDVFVDWCFIQAFGVDAGMSLLNQTYDGLGAGVKWSAQYYRKVGRFFERDPRPGDQIFFGDGDSWWHTGIVTGVEKNRVYTVEGNTSGEAGVVANGGCVAEKSYPLQHRNIKGYGRPDYALVEEEEEVDQSKFDEMLDDWLKRQAEKPDAQWGAEWEAAKAWAEEQGILRGDGDGNRQYQSYTTRQAMVLLLYRMEQRLKGGEL